MLIFLFFVLFNWPNLLASQLCPLHWSMAWIGDTPILRFCHFKSALFLTVSQLALLLSMALAFLQQSKVFVEYLGLIQLSFLSCSRKLSMVRRSCWTPW